MRAADVDHGWGRARLDRQMSWSAIARMAGCSELDLRRYYDPAAVSADWTARPVSARETIQKGLRRAGFGPDHALILSRLWAARTGRCRSADLAAGIGGGEAAREICHEAKRNAFNRGVTFVQGSGGFALTEDGVRRLAELAQQNYGRAAA